MNDRVFERETVLDQPLDAVFAFFSQAENLERLTPNSLKFEIITPLPIEMKVGTLIDYRIRLSGIPMRWRTRIAIWEPPHRFVDDQLRGPYLRWWHQHTFTAEGSKTRMRDRVEYRVPGGPFEPLIHKLFVRPQIEAIFDYREKTIRKLFGAGEKLPAM